jgi:hypothetical protein
MPVVQTFVLNQSFEYALDRKGFHGILSFTAFLSKIIKEVSHI